MRELGVISDAAGLRRLGLHAAVIVATGALVYAASGPARLFAVLGHGIALVTLFAPLHEATHRTAFRRRWLNDAVALVAGLALAAPARHFRWYHLAHHRHAQDPEHDPELTARKPETLGAYLLHVAGLGSHLLQGTTVALRLTFAPNEQTAGGEAWVRFPLAGTTPALSEIGFLRD